MDYGAKVAEKATAKVEKQIRKVYEQAAREISEKLKAFRERHAAKDKMMREKLENGLITKAEYRKWMRGQVFMENQWKEKADQASRILSEANKEAAKIVHDGTMYVFAENYNHTAYELAQNIGSDLGFNLYNAESAGRLISKRPEILPKWKIDEKKDYKWNYGKINNAVTQGMIQGESIDQITDRLVSSLVTQNENKMRTFARTAMTGAQNAGRQKQMEDAEDMGIEVKKKWVATLDDRTRDTHQELDGQEVPVDEPFEVDGMEIMYPGDPSAEPGLVYNCRCTMIQVYEGIERHSVRRARDSEDEDSYEVEDMTYREWKEWKENGKN